MADGVVITMLRNAIRGPQPELDDEEEEENELVADTLYNEPEEIPAEEVKAEKPIDTEAVKAFLATDIDSIYETLTKEQRRTLWRSVIDEIVLDGTEPVGIKIKA